jgi:hypothetical protein
MSGPRSQTFVRCFKFELDDPHARITLSRSKGKPKRRRASPVHAGKCTEAELPTKRAGEQFSATLNDPEPAPDFSLNKWF